ncbi:hypothetical protein TNCV_2500321 [Trichonephila clavipes]|nr:hypothetical protein TNCV_2500321 [Trichonephila clavipes]
MYSAELYRGSANFRREEPNCKRNMIAKVSENHSFTNACTGRKRCSCTRNPFRWSHPRSNHSSRCSADSVSKDHAVHFFDSSWCGCTATSIACVRRRKNADAKDLVTFPTDPLNPKGIRAPLFHTPNKLLTGERCGFAHCPSSLHPNSIGPLRQ